MSKGSGIWVACYAELFDHPKTLALAELLRQFLDEEHEDGWPPAMERLVIDVAAACIMRAHMALLERFSPDGSFAVPSGQEHRFVALAWPALPGYLPRPPLLTWFVQVGLAVLVAEKSGKRVYQLHEYEIHNRALLRNRPSYNTFCKERESRGTPRVGASVGATGRSNVKETVTGNRLQEEETPPPPPRGGSHAERCKQILKLWIEVKARFRTKWVAHKSLPAKTQEAIRSRWDDWPDLALWRAAMEAAAQDEHWSGRKPSDRHLRGWPAPLSSFTRPDHFDRWITAAQESDWRYAGNEDAAWERWFEQVEDGEIWACDLEGYSGSWPTDGALTPREQTEAAKVLRAWWKPNVYRKENP